ncbi:MAG: glycosyltransferase N-terminal domain-containing protein [Cyclobacteriaceae bacterium]
MYSLGINIIAGLVKIVALFNAKTRAFVNGRSKIFSKLENAFQNEQSPVAWVHCASLGEFEQGRPVIEQFRKEFPTFKILLTFFSPSGYEVRKNYAQADYIFYLPWDTLTNAKRFIKITKPQIAFFIKYEFWHNYAQVLSNNNIPLLSVSSIFREDQIFFKSYAAWFRTTLRKFDHFFVQNEKSDQLLKSLGLKNITIAGDTRFDRVSEVIKKSKEIQIAEEFKGSDNTMVIGSCWSEDLELLVQHINGSSGKLKFIIAPHEIKESFLIEIETSLNVKTIRYSQAKDNVNEYDVLIVDNVGMLSSLYRYGEFAFVGGGFGKGLHNILEAACYGIPIFFGSKNYQKFQEAIDLIMRGGAFEVNNYTDFKSKYELLINRPENYLLACDVTKSYVKENIGATQKVIDHCHTLLDKK